MNITLPSKKIQALIIVVIALFASYFLYSINFREKLLSFLQGASSKGKLELIGEANTVAADKDTDKDGLRDWQEVLWKTDVNDPDTDKDGTQDGEEVSNGRDPMIAGPKDTLIETRGVTAEASLSLADSINKNPDNMSTTLSRGLFAQFISLEQNGQLTDESQEQLVMDAVAGLSLDQIPPEYTIADVKIVPTDTISLKTYGNGLAKAISTYQTTVGAYSNNNYALVNYDKMINEIAALPVPSSLGLTHLQLINTMYVGFVALTSVADYQTDPVKALLSLKTFEQSGDKSQELLKTIAGEFKNNGIIFANTEPGNIWNNY